jgi:hypothetical protein
VPARVCRGHGNDTPASKVHGPSDLRTGLELVGWTLYTVGGSGPQDVSVARLRRDGGERRARWVVNARFGIPSPDTAPFWVTRLPTH